MTELSIQSKHRLVITGASGTVGQCLMTGLADLRPTPVSRRFGVDLTRAEAPERAIAGHDALIHLAWAYASGDDRDQGRTFYENITLTDRVLAAAQKVGIRRVVLASSVHADYFYDHVGPEPIEARRTPRGSDAYGSAKVVMERLAAGYAGDDFQVTCVRLGAVTTTDAPHATDAWERRVWLSHRDCCDLHRRLVTMPALPEDFSIVYAVSDNAGRVHSLANPVGWSPQDRAESLTPATEPVA